MEKTISYTCVFDSTKQCEVKQTFKLVPESLVEFCKICHQAPNQPDFKTFFDIIRVVSDLKERIGGLNAEIEIYKPIFEKVMTQLEAEK